MQQDTTSSIQIPEDPPKDVLTDLLRSGAQKMLAVAIGDEVGAYYAVVRRVP